MGNYETVLTLCEIIEKQNAIIRRQADALAQMGAVCMEEEVSEAKEQAEAFIGIGGDIW